MDRDVRPGERHPGLLRGASVMELVWTKNFEGEERKKKWHAVGESLLDKKKISGLRHLITITITDYKTDRTQKQVSCASRLCQIGFTSY